MLLERLVLRGALCALAAMSLAGCEVIPLRTDTTASRVNAPPVDRAATSGALLSGYLELLQRLMQGTPAEQAEIVASAQREYEQTPTPSQQLRCALVLSAPGHPSQDLPRAQRMLRELLAIPETLMPAERAFALLQLQQIDDKLTLVAENRRLQADATRNDRDRLTATSRRLQAETEENARLRKDLDEARAKLDAIANIERSLNERKPNSEGRTP